MSKDSALGHEIVPNILIGRERKSGREVIVCGSGATYRVINSEFSEGIYDDVKCWSDLEPARVVRASTFLIANLTEQDYADIIEYLAKSEPDDPWDAETKNRLHTVRRKFIDTVRPQLTTKAWLMDAAYEFGKVIEADSMTMNTPNTYLEGRTPSRARFLCDGDGNWFEEGELKSGFSFRFGDLKNPQPVEDETE